MTEPALALHLAAGNLFGGVEAFLCTLARHSGGNSPLRSEFALCFPGRLGEELRRHGAAVHWLGETRFRRPQSVLRANWALCKLLSARRFDAIVTHGAWPHALFGPTVRALGQRLVAWGHGAPLRPGVFDRFSDRISADLLIANSAHTAGEMAPWFAAVPRRVIYCPVDARRPSRPRSEVRAALGAEEDCVVILSAARLERWKGHRLLLEGVSRLGGRGRSWQLWLCGGAQRPHERAYLAELRAFVEQKRLTERVRFLGQRADVPDLMGAADLFCQPNTGPEPFGIVFVEALLAGLPVVATNLGGAAEILDDSCGLLVEPDADALAVKLASLVDDTGKRRTLAAAGPARGRALCEPTRRIADIAEALRGRGG